MATPAPQVPSWMKGTPDEAEYLQALIDGDTRTITAFDSIYNVSPTPPVTPATTGDTTPTPARQEQARRDPFSSISPAGEELRQQQVQEGFGKGYEVEQELTEFTFIDPAIELPKRALMMDLNEQEQKQFKQMSQYFMENAQMDAVSAMYAARNRLRVIKEAQRTLPYPQPIVEEGETGKRVEPFAQETIDVVGPEVDTSMMGLGRQTLQTPSQFKQQETMRNRGAKERQTMETSFRIRADQEAEQQGFAAGTQAYEDYVEPRVIALRRNWLEQQLTVEMVQLAREIIAQEKEQRGETIKYVNGRPVYEADPNDKARVGQIANALIFDYEQGVYPPDWMADPMGGNDPNYSYAQKTFGDKFMEDLFTTRKESGELVETRTAQVLRGVGGLIRPVTEGIVELTTYDVDAAGNPIDPQDINYGSFIGQPITRIAEETGQRTDLPRETLEKGGVEGWAERTAQSVARGRFLGEDFYDQPNLANALGGEENAWILGLGVEVMLPVTPMPVVASAGKTAKTTGKVLQQAGKGTVGTLTPVGAEVGFAVTRTTGKALETTGDVLIAAGQPFRTAGGYARAARARKAVDEVAGSKVGRVTPEGTVPLERAMAQEAAAKRVAGMTDDFTGRTRDVAPEALDPMKASNGATTRAAQMADDTMRIVDDAIDALDAARGSGRLSPVLEGPFGSRLAFEIGKYAEDGQQFMKIMAEGPENARQANYANQMALAVLNEFSIPVKVGLVAQEIETMFARLNPEGYVFVTPTLVMKKEKAAAILDGPQGVNRKMKQGVEVVFDQEDVGRILVDPEVIADLAPGKTINEVLAEGVPKSDAYRAFEQRAFEGAFTVDETGKIRIDFNGTEEMEQLFGFLKGGLVKNAGGLEPLQMSERAFDLASQDLSRQLITREIASVFKAVGDITPKTIRDGVKGMYQAAKRKGPFKPEGAELPVQTIRFMRQIKNELDNIPRAIAEDFKDTARANPDFTPEQVFDEVLGNSIDTAFALYLSDKGRLSRTGLGKRAIDLMGTVGPRGGRKTGRQVLNQRTKLLPDEAQAVRDDLLAQGATEAEIDRAFVGIQIAKEDEALLPTMRALFYQDEVGKMVQGFFGDAATTIPKIEFIDIVQGIRARNPNAGTLAIFEETVVTIRKKYPYLNKKGFGGVFDGDQVNVYLMTFVGNQKKNQVFLENFNEFAVDNPQLLIEPAFYRGVDTELADDIIRDYGFDAGIDTSLRQALMREITAGMSEDSVNVFQRRFNAAMDDVFSEGSTQYHPQNGTTLQLVDSFVTRKLVSQVRDRLLADVGEERLKTSLGFKMRGGVVEPVSDQRLYRTLKEQLQKDFLNDASVGRYLGLNDTAVEDYLRSVGIPMKPGSDLNRLRPTLQSLGGNEYLLVDAMAKQELDVLRRMTAAGSMDEAIKFYNTRGQTVGQYVLGSVGRFINHGTNGIKGGLLGGTLAPNGRYLGVNTFTAWSITAVTTPRYTGMAMARALPTMITQFTKAAQRFGPAGTAGAGASFGGLLGFLAGGPVGGVSGFIAGGAGGAMFARTVPNILKSLRGNGYSVRFLQAFAEADPNIVLYTGIDGKKYTAGMIQQMLKRNNIYRSEVTFEFGVQMIEDLKRTARLGGKGGANDFKAFLDGAVGQVVGRKSYWNSVAEESDNAFRTQVFIDSILLGMTEDQAAEMARVALLDYGAVSPMAKQYLRPLFLFFAFSTQITKEAFLAFLRADPAAANNIGRQIRISQSYAKEERTDILNQYADRNLTRLWSKFGDSFDEYHTIHYGLQSPSIEGFYNFVKTGEFIYDLAGVSDDIGLSPEMSRQFKEKFILGSNPILKMYSTGYRGTESGPQGFLTAREAIMWEQSGMMPLAEAMFKLEKITDPEKLREGEPTFAGAQYRFKDAEGQRNYTFFKAVTMSMGVDRNLTDWGTTTAMAMGLQDAELKRFKGEWYLYAIGLDTPLKAPNYLQIEDKIRQQQLKEIGAFKK